MSSSLQPKPTTRYRENASTAVATAASLPAVPSMAAPTLGSLLSTPNLAPLPSTGPSTLNPLSLSRLLTQALHSSDAPLLNQCLSHSDATLIRETVRRLQPELSVVLLERLAERLALGGKGRAGGASAQRMRGVGAWTRGVLRERIAYLVSVRALLFSFSPRDFFLICLYRHSGSRPPSSARAPSPPPLDPPSAHDASSLALRPARPRARADRVSAAREGAVARCGSGGRQRLDWWCLRRGRERGRGRY